MEEAESARVTVRVDTTAMGSSHSVAETPDVGGDWRGRSSRDAARVPVRSTGPERSPTSVRVRTPAPPSSASVLVEVWADPPSSVIVPVPPMARYSAGPPQRSPVVSSADMPIAITRA